MNKTIIKNKFNITEFLESYITMLSLSENKDFKLSKFKSRAEMRWFIQPQDVQQAFIRITKSKDLSDWEMNRFECRLEFSSTWFTWEEISEIHVSYNFDDIECYDGMYSLVTSKFSAIKEALLKSIKLIADAHIE